ncbi:MAG: hypothetical protein P4N41_07595 [Negativicutes bacterium]|nr:hypothetical protein [Negativicutes bacterium]
MSECSTIVAILQERRVETAPKVQDILTEFGCDIRVRLGLHDAGMESCSNTGLILLQFCGGKDRIKDMESKLQSLPNVKVKSMSLEF